MLINPIIDLIIFVIGCFILMILWGIPLPLGNGASFPTSSTTEFGIFLISLPIVCLLFVLIIFDGLEFIFWDISSNGGILIFLVIITIILIIFLLYFYDKKSKNEEKKVIEIVEANSINIDERIINMVIYLKKNKKELFCRVYNISSTNNVDILKFIAKNWVSSSDIHKDEMARLFLSLKFINGRYPESNIYSSLMSSMPRSLIHKVMVRDNYICQKCGKNIQYAYEKEKIEWPGNIDLIKPLSEGGTLTEDNLIIKCFDCKEDEGFN